MIDRIGVFETLASGLPMLVADLDTGRILWASRPLEELFGYTLTGELETKTVDVLVPSAIQAGHQGHRRSFAANPVPRVMGARNALLGQRKDGTTFPVEVGLYPGAPGGQKLVVAIVLDMTTRKAAEPH